MKNPRNNKKRIDASCSTELVDGKRTNMVSASHGSKITRLWWRFSDGFTVREPRSCNHALTALLPLAMQHDADLHIRGAVNRSLMENLEEVIDAWTLWRPDLFHRIRLSADELTFDTPSQQDGAALMFSGGVDAAYALIAHKLNMLGHRNRDVRSAVMVQGFDIPLTDNAWFSTAQQNALSILSRFNCPLLEVQSNWRVACVNWEMTHGFGLTSVLHQLDGSVGTGLWAADEPYNREVIPWGNNSISNPLMSGGAFPVRTVGAGLSRSAKIGVIASHEVVRDHIRVCWRHPKNGLNCGTCEKCVRTRLALSAHGFDEVKAFPGRLTTDLVSRIDIGNQIQYELLKDVLHIPDSRLPPELLAALRARLFTYETASKRNSQGWRQWLARALRP